MECGGLTPLLSGKAASSRRTPQSIAQHRQSFRKILLRIFAEGIPLVSAEMVCVRRNTPRWRNVMLNMRTTYLLLALAFIFLAVPCAADQRKESFDKDPGWDGHNNRIARAAGPRDCPAGFRLQPEDSARRRQPGEIGGSIQPAAEPAYYAKPIPVKTLNDRLMRLRQTARRQGREQHAVRVLQRQDHQRVADTQRDCCPHPGARRFLLGARGIHHAEMARGRLIGSMIRLRIAIRGSFRAASRSMVAGI